MTNPVRMSLKKVLPRGNVIRTLPFGIGRGIRMGVDFHQGQTQLFFGLYEVELNGHLKRIAKPGYRAFDIGGHYGYDALVLAKLTGGDVLSVEADPVLAARIVANAEANPRLSVTTEAAFVSARDEEGCVTIDALANRHFLPDLLKIDIEGAEVEALRGAGHVLRERRPAILLEVHTRDGEWECLEILKDAGYVPPTIVERRTWIPEHRPIDHNRWLIFPG